MICLHYAVATLSTIHSFFASDLGKALLPPIGAVIVAMIGAAVGWGKDLTRTSRRIRLLEEATKRVEFWELWFKTLCGIGGGTDADKAGAEREMRIAAVRVRELLAHSLHASQMTVAEFRDYKDNHVGKVRQYLMLYEEPSTSAALWRKILYLVLLVLIAEGLVVDSYMRARVLAIFPDLPGYAHFVGLAAVLIALGNFSYKARKLFIKQENDYLAELSKREAGAIAGPEGPRAQPAESTLA